VTERFELLDDLWVDVPDGWHAEREGDSGLLLADPDPGFVTNLFAHETSTTPDQLLDGIRELPGGVILAVARAGAGRSEVRFGYATDGESLTGVRVLIDRPASSNVLVHATMPTRRLATDALIVDAVLSSIGAA
jgi:hypothetical protein